MTALGIVVPAYNEAGRIGRTLDAAAEWLGQRGDDWQLLVVDDGSSDTTVEIVRAKAETEPRISVVAQPSNRGKGAAVRRGMLELDADRLLFMDADLATPMGELRLLEEALDAGADIAIGSRGRPESNVRRSQGKLRETMGKTFNLIVRSVALGGISDTQCGFKLFTRRAATEVFQKCTVDRFAFDVEVLMIAQAEGFRIAEVPVEWSHVPDSRVSPFTDAMRMLSDVLKLRLRRAVRGWGDRS